MLALEVLVALAPLFGDEGGVAGEVDPDEDDAAAGPVGEGVGGEHLAVHEPAPAAPVAAGEVDYRGEGARAGEGDGGVVVLRPDAWLGAGDGWGDGEGPGGGREEGEDEGEQ